MATKTVDDGNSSKVSKPSAYLSNAENELVFELMGQRCVSLCTAVAHMFTAASSSSEKWIRRHSGALCFIEDITRCSSYFRMYCLVRNELLWEHELNDTIEIAQTRPCLLTFRGQVFPKHER